jgi:hypothetical protein
MLAAASALIASSPASAEGIHVTKEQVGGLAGSAALGAVGGPVGGFFGGLLGRRIVKAFEKKPPQLGPVDTPAAAGPVHWMSAERPLQLQTIDTDKDDISIDNPPEPAVQRTIVPPATQVRTTPVSVPAVGDMPPKGTLNYQLAALSRGQSPAD